MSVALIVGLLLLTLILGVPVAFALGFSASVGLVLLVGGTASLNQVAFDSYGALSDFVLVAVPLYILMAQILLAGGVGRDLFAVGDVWLRHLPGGLAVAAIISCAIFAAISGSSVATAAIIGLVAIPEMVRRGYPRRPVLGALAAGGTLGILIPPSIPMILYGSITQESVGALFSAGILPGIMMMTLFAGYASFAFGRQVAREPATSWGERLSAVRKAIWGLLAPVLIIGGIYSGVFTPTEAAAIGVVYSLFITMLIYRTVTWRTLPDVLLKTTKDSTMILMIIVGALLFGQVLTILRVPQEITEMVSSQEMSRWLVLAAIILLLTVMGMFLEVASTLLITIPIIFPIITALGFDPIWFAVVFVIVMEVALVTPPVGLNLFVVQGISGGESLMGVVRGIIPFFVLMVVGLLIVIFFPSIATLLPSLRN